MKHLPTDYPLFDHRYDGSRNAQSRPPLKPDDDKVFPSRFVMSFMGDVLARYVETHGCPRIAVCHSETRDFPIYRAQVEGADIGLVQAAVGAPAAAILADLLIASGTRAVVACGGCGVLNPHPSGMILIPEVALRDEGTSLCYCAPTRDIALDRSAVEAACRLLDKHGIPYKTCKTWTTDGFFRETPDLVEKRRGEGCDVVDMECAALAAVAQFYGVRFAHILYSGDSLADPSCHDARNWMEDHDARAVAFNAALALVAIL